MSNALMGIDKLKDNVDTLIVIPNDKLLEIVDRRTTMPEALKKADEVLQQAVQGITSTVDQHAGTDQPGFRRCSDCHEKTKESLIIGIGEAKGRRQSHWKLYSRLYPVRCLRQPSRVQAM